MERRREKLVRPVAVWRKMEVAVCSICLMGFHRRDQASFQRSLNR